MKNDLTYKPFGKKAILIEWQPKIEKNILKDIIAFKEKIFRQKQLQIEDIIVGYHSITLKYKQEISNFQEEVIVLQNIYKSTDVLDSKSNVVWEIPVCYNLEFGIDLEVFASEKGMSIDQVIRLHSKPIYTVHFIGFLPGFLYLGGLNATLQMPRKSTPRLTVSKGAVGIGGEQTGVYPNKSAGGWNIIGKTPIPFFNVDAKNACFAKIGDGIKFVPISLEIYTIIEKKVAKNRYQLQKKARND